MIGLKVKLVRPLTVRIMCDTYLCDNYAEYEVGHPIQPGLCMHYCSECLRQVSADFAELDAPAVEPAAATAADTAEEPKSANITAGESKTTSQDNKTADAGETTDTDTSSEVAEQPTEAKEEKKTATDVYTCKYCGMTFAKPDGLSEYRRHMGKCRAEHDK